MSQENVETERRKANAQLVRTLYETFNRRNLGDLVALYDERVEIVSFAAAIEGVLSYRGHDGVRAWYRNLVETLEMIIETGELLAYRNLVLSIPRIRVRVGGADTIFEQGIVYEVRDGRILRSLGYKDAGTGLVAMGRLLLGQPLEAAGLSD
jgi:ketosteroid isomerase-like protein